jgi:hypothetical protein
MNAKCYSDIDDDSKKGIALAARILGEKTTNIEGYFLSGGNWDVESPEELAELIVECWREQAGSN